MTLVDVLAARGILRGAEVVELAQAAGLDLAAACVLLAKESGGGRNVWGHDDVPTGGAYDKGGAVTRGNYLAYTAAIARGAAGWQGCGPTQLTYGPYQALADRIGGCWDWRANVRTGFGILARLIAEHGERGGFRRYNGSGPAAERYADDAMSRLKQWRGWLADAQEDDMPLSDADVEKVAAAVWRHAIRNGFGDTVAAEQILTGAEKRTAEILDAARLLVERTGVRW